MREETKQDIISAEDRGTKYDEAAKAIWRNREILAPLLKYAVRELEDEPVENIIRLIDADSIRDDVPVSDLPPAVTDRGTVQTSLTEKPITYDFRFKVKNPKLSSQELLVMLHIDLEFQNSYRPTLKDGRRYPIIKRGIYYAAREISSQLGRITSKTNYDDLEKVIGIWVVNERIPQDIQNTATRYYIEKDDYIGQTAEPKADYDLMEIVIVRRGEHGDITKPLFDYLKSVFDANLAAIEKYTPAGENADIVKEVSDMPGMGASIYNDGYHEGYGTGYDTGYGTGFHNAETATIVDLVRDGDITVERAAEKLHKSPDEIRQLLNELIAELSEQNT